MTLVAVIASPWWGRALLAQSSYFAVRHVEVIGARYLAAEAVVARLGLGAGATVWVDRGDVERAVLATPGVTAARVTRRLPGTLVVTVEERQPVALARGPGGLIAVAEDGDALPYDVAVGPVDAPLVERPVPGLTRGLAAVRATDPGLYAATVTARLNDGLELDLNEGRILLDAPVDERTVRAVAAVRRDLAARGMAWREVDGRFRGWVVVRPRAAGDSVRGGA